MRWANVVLMCSQNEAFGRVTVEALKSGRPVVGTRSGGTPELITDGIDGFVFEPGSAPALAAALRRLAGDPELLALMAERASTGVEDRFTTEREVDLFVDVFTAVAGASPSGLDTAGENEMTTTVRGGNVGEGEKVRR